MNGNSLYFSAVFCYIRISFRPYNPDARKKQPVFDSVAILCLDQKKEQQHVNEELRHKTEKLRHDTDNTFALMTSQLEKKLLTLRNSSADEQHLLNNYTVLQKDFDTLATKFTEQEKELIVLRNKTVEMEENIMSLKGQTYKYEKKIEDLQKLQSIQPLHDIQMLQHQVKILTAVTDSLSGKEVARSQDLLALYNKTLATEQKTSYLDVRTNTLIKDFNQFHNETVKQLDSFGANFNSTGKWLDQKIENATQQVAITSCISGGYGWSMRGVGETIKFPDIVTAIGVGNLSSFKSSGKFTCSNPGLYLVTVHILSNTELGEFEVLHNGHQVSHMYLAQHPGNTWHHSSSVVVTLLLQTGDDLLVQPMTSFTTYGQKTCCLSVVKLK